MQQKCSEADWLKCKPKVADLYGTQNRTVEQVVEALRNDGYNVSKRTLRNKINGWGYDKNHKPNEMSTALCILSERGYSDQNRPPDDLIFSIRQSRVSFKEITRYYRRKDIYNPFSWLAAQFPETIQRSLSVNLLRPSKTKQPMAWDSSPGASSSTNYNPFTPSFSASPSSTAMMMPSSTFVPALLEGCDYPAVQDTPLDIGSIHSSKLYLGKTRSFLSLPVSSPQEFRDTEQLVWLTASYCSAYLDSPRAQQHAEPPVHHDTIHGRFGNEMQNGISAVLDQNNAERASVAFSAAFSWISVFLRDDHPMGFAQLYAALCELAVRAITDRNSLTKQPEQEFLAGILVQSIAYISEFAAEIFPGHHPIKATFSLLRRTENVSEQVLRMMQRMIASFAALAEQQAFHPSYWKLLYLKERYCDCLYHANMHGLGHNLRAQLLNEQEQYYGKTTRNVLWTLMNVADNHLWDYRPDDAERLFRDALSKADSLDNFGRAKTRFAALEGLARTSLLKAEMMLLRKKVHWCAGGDVTCSETPIQRRLELLKAAERFCGEAEVEARTWFGSDSRRTIRIAGKRSDLIGEIEKLKDGGLES